MSPGMTVIKRLEGNANARVKHPSRLRRSTMAFDDEKEQETVTAETITKAPVEETTAQAEAATEASAEVKAE
jgi:hypothetical protein